MEFGDRLRLFGADSLSPLFGRLFPAIAHAATTHRQPEHQRIRFPDLLRRRPRQRKLTPDAT